MKINIEAEGMGRIPHSEKMGACYNYSSGIAGEIVMDPSIQDSKANGGFQIPEYRIYKRDAMGNPIARMFGDSKKTGIPTGPEGITGKNS